MSGKAILHKTVALVGMMGAGKTSIGRRLGARLEVPFADADHEIETAAGMAVSEIFAKYGEPEFRRLERSVIARLLHDPPQVLATGGGAYMDETTRNAMRQHAFTIWLKAPVEILLGRVRKRQGLDKGPDKGPDNVNGQTRPLLANDDPRGTLEKLLEAREPVYAMADMVLESADEPHAVLLDKIVAALGSHGICEAA
jgi:shikimate kinase